MRFKIDDLIILTEEGIGNYWTTKARVEDIFCVLSTNEEASRVCAYRLNDQQKNRFSLRGANFRIATELEVKKYKMKKLFVE
jgi:hypothetical protein